MFLTESFLKGLPPEQSRSESRAMLESPPITIFCSLSTTKILNDVIYDVITRRCLKAFTRDVLVKVFKNYVEWCWKVE